VVGCGDVVVQRRVKPVGVAGQPVAKEGQQFAELDRVGGIETEEGAYRLCPGSRAYRTERVVLCRL
jgi:hypothetical protein